MILNGVSVSFFQGNAELALPYGVVSNPWRFAARVWRDYYKHVDARRRYANPTDEGLIAQQRDRQIEEDSRRRENEERVAQYNYFAARASNRSAWARAGMG